MNKWRYCLGKRRIISAEIYVIEYILKTIPTHSGGQANSFMDYPTPLILVSSLKTPLLQALFL